MPVTIYPTSLKYKNQNGQFQSATAIKGDSGKAIVEQVSGTTPTIVCEDNHRYICEEVLNLTITPPANGACEIIFESGSTATLLVVPNTMKWPEWFNPNALEANATYQFKLSNGLANVAIWPDEGLTGDTRVRIQKMLGIYEAPWELIREDTFTNAEDAEHEITVDGNGESFILSDVLFMFEQKKQEDASSFNGSIFFHYAYSTGIYSTPIKTECGSWTQAANTPAHGTYIILKQDGKLLELYRTAQTTSSNTGNLGARYTEGFSSPGNTDRVGIYVVDTPVYINKIRIGNTVGTGHYKLYGKRKWN